MSPFEFIESRVRENGESSLAFYYVVIAYAYQSSRTPLVSDSEYQSMHSRVGHSIAWDKFNADAMAKSVALLRQLTSYAT